MVKLLGRKYESADQGPNQEAAAGLVSASCDGGRTFRALLAAQEEYRRKEAEPRPTSYSAAVASFYQL